MAANPCRAYKRSAGSLSAKTVSMVPDPNWWGAKPHVDRIITRALEGDAGVNAFVNGEVDVNLIPNDPSSYKRAAGAKNGVVRVAGGPDFRHFTFNGTSPNLKDQNVRQAIDRVHPWAVDSARSTEHSPGVKDHDAVRAWVGAAR